MSEGASERVMECEGDGCCGVVDSRPPQGEEAFEFFEIEIIFVKTHWWGHLTVASITTRPQRWVSTQPPIALEGAHKPHPRSRLGRSTIAERAGVLRACFCL
jgi:hypothetical protein